jgi:hypothetical protein
MLAARITCPRCGQQLTVTESAPPRVTCPVCLAALVNPASPYSGVPRPVPVIPLDHQVARDTRWVTWLIYALLALLAFMAIVTIAHGTFRSGMYMILIAGGLATFLYFFGEIRADMKSPPAPTPEGAAPSVPPEPGRPAVLEYGLPRGPSRPPATAGAVAAGFFSAIGVCAAGFYVLAITADWSGGSASAKHSGHAMILAGVVILVIGFLGVVVRVGVRWRGLVAGATAGLCLGLLALGPCAACYLLTL